MMVVVGGWFIWAVEYVFPCDVQSFQSACDISQEWAERPPFAHIKITGAPDSFLYYQNKDVSHLL